MLFQSQQVAEASRHLKNIVRYSQIKTTTLFSNGTAKNN